MSILVRCLRLFLWFIVAMREKSGPIPMLKTGVCQKCIENKIGISFAKLRKASWIMLCICQTP